jgi:hypothetical protein
LEVGTQNPASYISIKDFMKLIYMAIVKHWSCSSFLT